MKIASWNVNSLRVRLEQVLDWIGAVQPDVLGLQETKVADEQFPAAELRAAGYEPIYTGEKAYNGVALLSRNLIARDVITAMPDLDDAQRRLIGASYGPVRVINLYVPNGEHVESDKYRYKLHWLERLAACLRVQLAQHRYLVVLGDFNIAPEPRDVHDPEIWEGRVLFSEPERAALRHVLEVGLCDTFRLHEQTEGAYSWWDYRMGAFRRNLGLRIDHILASTALCERCISCRIDKTPRAWQRPSDHAPVIAEFDV